MFDFYGTLVIAIWATTVVTRSALLAWPRSKLERWPLLAYLAECPLCMGTWVGFASGFLLGHNPLVSAAATSLLAYAGNTLIDTLGELGRWLAIAEKIPPRDGGAGQR